MYYEYWQDIFPHMQKIFCWRNFVQYQSGIGLFGKKQSIQFKPTCLLKLNDNTCKYPCHLEIIADNPQETILPFLYECLGKLAFRSALLFITKICILKNHWHWPTLTIQEHENLNCPCFESGDHNMYTLKMSLAALEAIESRQNQSFQWKKKRFHFFRHWNETRHVTKAPKQPGCFCHVK